jgi:hypothetical protein
MGQKFDRQDAKKDAENKSKVFSWCFLGDLGVLAVELNF